MTDEYVPREEDPILLRNLQPGSPREQTRVENIKKIIRKYMVGGTEEDLDAVALRIWREIKR